MAHDGTYTGVSTGIVRLSDDTDVIILSIQDERGVKPIILRSITARRIAAQLNNLVELLELNDLPSTEN